MSFRIRYSIRFALGLLLMTAVALGLLSQRRSTAIRQSRAVQQIEAAGGWVKYDYEVNNHDGPYGPGWLVQIAGRDATNNVVQASLYRDFNLMASLPHLEFLEILSATDEDLSLVAQCANLTELHVRNSRVGSEATRAISKLHNLVILDLGGSQFTDSHLYSIGQSPKLRELVLSYCRFNEQDFEQLQPLHQLETIKLSGCDLTDAGLAHLQRCHQLRRLALEHTKITDEGLSSIVNLVNLTHLNLRGTEVGDHAMQWLTAMKNLESLNLSETKIADHGVAALEPLEQLQHFDLSRTQVSDQVAGSMRAFGQLRTLNLSYTRLSSPTVHEIAKSLPNTLIEAENYWGRSYADKYGNVPPWQFSSDGGMRTLYQFVPE